MWNRNHGSPDINWCVENGAVEQRVVEDAAVDGVVGHHRRVDSTSQRVSGDSRRSSSGPVDRGSSLASAIVSRRPRRAVVIPTTVHRVDRTRSSGTRSMIDAARSMMQLLAAQRAGADVVHGDVALDADDRSTRLVERSDRCRRRFRHDDKTRQSE
jgi:hypothetical protein